jgi:hypothetical protein
LFSLLSSTDNCRENSLITTDLASIRSALWEKWVPLCRPAFTDRLTPNILHSFWLKLDARARECTISALGRMHQPVVIAIDGPAGAGKSTGLAERLGLDPVDSGATYRAANRWREGES